MAGVFLKRDGTPSMLAGVHRRARQPGAHGSASRCASSRLLILRGMCCCATCILVGRFLHTKLLGAGEGLEVTLS